VNSQKILEAAKRYRGFFEEYGTRPIRHRGDVLCVSAERALGHAHWMVNEIPTLLGEDRKEKAMRWLCFVQGVLWIEKLQTIDQLKEINRPD